METFSLVLAAIPIVLWGLGGFKSSEVAAEAPKLVVWYAIVGLIYFVFV
jgi:hypothetical protein